MKCEKCGFVNEEGYLFCRKCGAKLIGDSSKGSVGGSVSNNAGGEKGSVGININIPSNVWVGILKIGVVVVPLVFLITGISDWVYWANNYMSFQGFIEFLGDFVSGIAISGIMMALLNLVPHSEK